jgi:hypothetical protein
MQTIMRTKSGYKSLMQGAKDPEDFIFEMLPAALSNVPFHNDTQNITRFFAKDFPFHVAVHEVSPLSSPPERYTLPHLHIDNDEVNIILSSKSLLYRIQVGGDERVVQNNSAIWIPRGIIHSANVLEGEGYFVTMRIGNH